MPNEDPSNASRRRKREARKALSLPDKESVHGIISPILSEPIPGKRKASIGLFETRLLPLRGEERQERGDYFNKSPSSGILDFRKDVLLLFNISPNPTSLNQSPNLNPTSLTTTKPPTAGEPTLLYNDRCAAHSVRLTTHSSATHSLTGKAKTSASTGNPASDKASLLPGAKLRNYAIQSNLPKEGSLV